MLKITRNQFIANVILFIPLFVLNFFAYGADGCGRLVKEMNKYAQKYFKKEA